MDDGEWLWIVGAALLGYGLYTYLRTSAPQTSSAISPFTPSTPVPGSQTVLPPMPNNNDADILTRTILGEARNQGEAGMEAVANVVINRYHAGNYPGGGSIAGICKAPGQFSCWNRTGSPAQQADFRYITSVQSSDPLYQEAYSIALRAISGSLFDNTNGATYYHENSVPTPQPPRWPAVVQTAEIGTQTFYEPETGSG